jgi:hypothetical protein
MVATVSSFPVSLRRLETRDELHELFRLRHDAYLACGFRRKPEPSGIDVDIYDACSEHVGAFLEVDGKPHLVGGIRAIFPAEVPSASTLRSLLRDVAPGSLAALGVNAGRLPTEMAVDLEPVLAPLRAAGHLVVEFSRTITRPGYRGGGLGSTLVHAVTAMAWLRGARYGIGSCPLARVPLYEGGGFRVIEEAGVFPYPGVELPSRALMLDLGLMPAEARQLAARWRKASSIHVRAEQPSSRSAVALS